MHRCIIIVLTGMLVIFQSVAATETYERKSISYVPVTALISDTVKVPADVRPVFAGEVISVFKEMSRWDHNQLPDAVIAEYRKQAGTNFKDQSALREIIESTIVTEVSAILQANVIDRAAALQDEADKRRFISEKAKELGIEETDIRKIMNSAFVGIPFISAFHAATADGSLKYKVTGGIAWYNIIASGDAVEVIYLAEVHHDLSASSKTTKTVYDPNTKKNKVVRRDMAEVRAEAMRKASREIAQRIRERTKNLSPFQLTTDVIAAEGGNISFALGGGEDVKLDDKYYLAEYRLNDLGETERYNVGFARVSSVGDNTEQNPSRARVIRSSAVITRGVSLIEHPRSGLEIRPSGRLRQIKFTPGRLVDANGYEYFSYNGTTDLSLYMANFGTSLNLARQTGVSQLYANMDLMATFHTLEGATIMEGHFEAGSSLILGGTMSMSKKFYMGPLAVGLEAGGGAFLWMFYYKFDEADNVNIAELRFNRLALGGLASGSLEYAASIDLNIGVSAGYWAGVPTDDWNLEVCNTSGGQGSKVPVVNQDRPELDITGLEARVYVTYAIL